LSGAAPGTVLQFPIPGGDGGGGVAQQQMTKQEHDKEKLLKQQYYQEKQDRKEKQEVSSRIAQKQEQKKNQHQYQQKQEKHEYNEQYQEYMRRDRQVAEMKIANKERQFEMIGLSKRTAVYPENTANQPQRRNNNPGAVYPEPATADASGGGGPPSMNSMERGQDKMSSLTNGQFYLCCCFDSATVDGMGDGCLCFTLTCCAMTGFLRYLPCYSKRLWSIKEGQVGIIEDIGGKYVRTQLPGPVLLSSPCCFELEQLRMTLPTRVQQIVVRSESKTKDNGNVTSYIIRSFIFIFFKCKIELSPFPISFVPTSILISPFQSPPYVF
jgi:hypothetical protein